LEELTESLEDSVEGAINVLKESSEADRPDEVKRFWSRKSPDF